MASIMRWAVAVAAALTLAALAGSAPALASTTVVTSVSDFSAGILVGLQLPGGIPQTSPEADVRLASGTPSWVANASWDGPSQGNRTFCAPTLGDLDRDGDLDLLVGRKDGQAFAYQNTGTRAAPAWSRLVAWDPPDLGAGVYSSPALDDLDGDGDLDLLLGRYDGQTWAYRNDGSGAPIWTREPAWDPPALVGTAHATPALGDLDLDGHADLIIGANNDVNQAYRSTGDLTGGLWQRMAAWDTPHEASRGWTQIALGDLDGDALPDLLLGDSRGTVSVYRNAGSFTGPVWTATPAWNPPQITAYATPAVGNIDDDRDLDLFLGAQKGTLDAVLDTGQSAPTSGTWTSPMYDSPSDELAWTALSWTARDIGVGATLTAEWRSGSTPGAVSAASWAGATVGPLPADVGRYLQIRFTFASTDPGATAALLDLTLQAADPVTGLTAVCWTRKHPSIAIVWDAPGERTDLFYEVYRDGMLVATTVQTSWTDRPSRVATGMGVSYRIVARDGAGLLVAQSTQLLTLR